MNNRIKMCILALLASTNFVNANSHFLGHNFSNNMTRELINVSRSYSSDCESDNDWFGNFYVVGQYQGSFNNSRSNGLGSMPSFGGSTTNVMTIGGEAAAS